MADSASSGVLDPATTLEELHEAEQANRQLRAAYSDIAALVGGLAHEIRNPLSTMRMNLDLLAEEFQEPETSRERRALQKIERVRKESHRLQGLLEDFLRFVRLNNLRTKPADLNAIVEEVRDFCEGQGVAQGILSRAGYDPHLPRVRLDVDLFKQALLNLVLNAQHAMPEGGELILTTRREGDMAVLEVLDTGCGIPPDQAERVFEVFFSTRPGGSGLGSTHDPQDHRGPRRHHQPRKRGG